MKLRFLVLCNKDGMKTEPLLQYWDEEFKRWENVDYVEMKDWEYQDTED